jgi:hypothetical protein
VASNLASAAISRPLCKCWYGDQDRPQEAESGDLAVRSEVGYQHGGQDEHVDDFGVY